MLCVGERLIHRRCGLEHVQVESRCQDRAHQSSERCTSPPSAASGTSVVQLRRPRLCAPSRIQSCCCAAGTATAWIGAPSYCSERGDPAAAAKHTRAYSATLGTTSCAVVESKNKLFLDLVQTILRCNIAAGHGANPHLATFRCPGCSASRHLCRASR